MESRSEFWMAIMSAFVGNLTRPLFQSRPGLMAARFVDFVGAVVRSREIIFTMTRRDFAVRYLGSYLGLIWAFLYNFQSGFLNRILFTAGVITEPINWAGHPSTAMLALTVPYIWRTLPFAILLIHAALAGMNRELFEAAAVDGANAWQRFRHITLPLLMPVIVVLLVLRTSFAFTVFEEVLAITQGGPGDATWVAVWFSYKRSFAPPFDIGLGAASAWILAIIVGLLAIAYVKFLYRRVT